MRVEPQIVIAPLSAAGRLLVPQYFPATITPMSRRAHEPRGVSGAAGWDILGPLTGDGHVLRGRMPEC